MIAYQLVGERAALGYGLDEFLRLQRDIHEIMRPDKDEIERGSDRRPVHPAGRHRPRAPEAPGG